jgi:hypothetical protein
LPVMSSGGNLSCLNVVNWCARPAAKLCWQAFRIFWHRFRDKCQQFPI